MNRLNHRRLKIILLFLYFLVLIVSCIHPVFPDEMFLQHSVTLVIAVLLIFVTVRNNLSDKAFICLFLFMIIHIIGARWIYSYTPYDSWIKSLTGISINRYFDFKRNEYDRFVHFMFGLLMMVPVSEIYRNWFKCPGKIATHIAFLFILSGSLIYELFEWLIGILLSPESAEAYNGQQGDFWDAQKDMALAAFGAIIMVIILWVKHRKRPKQEPSV